MKQTTTVMGNKKEIEYVCLYCGQYMTEHQAKEQMKRTGFDGPICCGNSMVQD